MRFHLKIGLLYSDHLASVLGSHDIEAKYRMAKENEGTLKMFVPVGPIQRVKHATEAEVADSYPPKKKIACGNRNIIMTSQSNRIQ